MASQFPPKKNAAFTLFFTLYKNDGSVIANPGTITKKISKDGGAIADIAAAVTEINTTYGLCSLVLSADEMNADAVSVYIIDDTSGCVAFTATLFTTSATFTDLKTETASILEDTGTTLDGIVDAILEDTGTTLPATLATIDGIVDDILVDTGTTLPATLTTIDGIVDDILVDTGTTLPATLAALPAAIWNYLTSALTTVGSIGKALAAWLASIPAGSTAFGSTDLAICNDALLLLGNNAIDDLTDDTKAAKLCTQYYQRTVDSVIRAYTWNCATVRSDELTATTDPTFGFSNAYTLPDDCLRVLKMYDDDTYKYRVENGALLCDEGTAQITYLKRIGAEDMDPLLAEAVAARLAATIAFSLTNSVSAAEAMWKLYKDKLDEAQTTDAFEGTAPQMASSDWVNARR